MDCVNESTTKNVHKKFATKTKSSNIEQRLNNMDLFMQRFTLHVSREFEAHKSMTRDAISSLGEQFAESFDQLNQSLSAKFKSLNKNLVAKTKSLHDKFDDIQSKPSVTDDKSSQQILDKMTEEHQAFNDKLAVIESYQETSEAACEELVNKLDKSTELIEELKGSFNSELQNIKEELKSQRKKQASSGGSSSDMQIILENLAVIECKTVSSHSNSNKLLNSVQAVGDLVKELQSEISNCPGTPPNPDTDTDDDTDAKVDSLKI